MESINSCYKIARLETEGEWHIVSNPKWTYPMAEYFGDLLLRGNTFHDYVEWKNCGVIYRIIRKENLQEYGLQAS